MRSTLLLIFVVILFKQQFNSLLIITFYDWAGERLLTVPVVRAQESEIDDVFEPAYTNRWLPSTSMTPTAYPPLAFSQVHSDPDHKAVLVGAGDIADCRYEHASLTADILRSITGTVFTTGDNAYEWGTADEFQNCYEPTWGRHKARTRPSPGNHDYVTENATG